MARAEAFADGRQSLYEQDFHLWLAQQAALLREGHLHELDVANLLDEIEDMGRSAKNAIKNNLLVLLTHLLPMSDPADGTAQSWSTGGGCAMTSRRARASICG